MKKQREAAEAVHKVSCTCIDCEIRREDEAFKREEEEEKRVEEGIRHAEEQYRVYCQWYLKGGPRPKILEDVNIYDLG